MILNSLHHYYDGVGSDQHSSALPLQTIPDSSKTKLWKQQVLDRLETIGLSQLSRNIEYRDYYKMTEGRLVYADFQAPPEIMRDVQALREEMELPTYIRHYDILGTIANQLVGELDSQKDKIRIDSIDEFAENDYIREKSLQVNEYTQQKFEVTLKRLLALKGINPEQDEFNSQEEQQQYLQFLQAEEEKVMPLSYREKELNKNWKVKAVEWGEHTLDADYQAFNMNDLEEDEFKDYILTGRFFTHYRVGYDYYKPERWSPLNTFFSQDVDIENPQDAEYVGRIHFMSASEILTKYGSKLSAKIQRQIAQVFDKGEEGPPTRGDFSFNDLKRPVGSETVPFEGYHDYDLTLQLQDALDTPLGERTSVGEDGELVKENAWMSELQDSNYYLGNAFAKRMRDDIEVRHDVFRVTEAYWRGWKRVGNIRYETDSGIIAEDIVTDDLLPQFLSENGIKRVNSVSLEDFEKSEEINVIAYTYIPVIYKGHKIGAGSSFLTEDIYFDIEELDYQIKGDSNLYDVKIPVAGIITNSLARKIRPYQLAYNICMNQIFNLLEKEIGMFFLMDINFLPSEWKELGDSSDIMAELRNFARDIGFIPTDMSKQNMNPQQTPQMNTLIREEISYDAQIARRVELAEFYKAKALEQIGINPQRTGTASQYTTAEGIKQGVASSYAQTKQIFSKYNNARRKKLEIHLSIAQYCQGTGKDISIFYRKSDGDTTYLKFQDPLFSLRQLGILPIADSKSRQELEMLRQTILQDNTVDRDVLDLAELMTSDSMQEIISIGRRNRQEALEQRQEQMQHEQTLIDKRLEAEAQKEQLELQNENEQNQLDRENDLERERIRSLGRAVDRQSDLTGIEQINKEADRAVKESEIQANTEIKNRELDQKEKSRQEDIRLREKDLQLRVRELKERKKQREAENFRSVVNKN